ncbi:MAG: hypothetical protein ACI8Y7_001054 [Candidatus Woesearchaeota archaeon]|jgi:hypothetical protein
MKKTLLGLLLALGIATGSAQDMRSTFSANQTKGKTTYSTELAIGPENGNFFTDQAKIRYNTGPVDTVQVAGVWKPTTGNVKHTVFGFGQFKNNHGIGFESKHTLRDVDVSLSLDRTPLAQHHGAALEKRFDAFSVEYGYDRVNALDKQTDHHSVNVELDVTSTDIVGGSYRKSTDAQKVTATYMHYGKKQAWGARNWMAATWTDTSRTIVMDSIIAHNPTFPRDAAMPFIDQSTYANGINRLNTTPNILTGTFLEDVRLANRTSKGFFTENKLIMKQEDTKPSTWSLRSEAGYKIPVGPMHLAPSYYHTTRSHGEDSHGAGIQLQIKRLRIDVSKDVKGQNGYARIQYTRSF